MMQTTSPSATVSEAQRPVRRSEHAVRQLRATAARSRPSSFHAEIRSEHPLVRLDFVWGVFCYGAAAVEHVKTITDRHHNPHVVLDQENAAAERSRNGLDQG